MNACKMFRRYSCPFLFIVCALIISGCKKESSEEKSEAYEGFSKMVNERVKANQRAKEVREKKKEVAKILEKARDKTKRKPVCKEDVIIMKMSNGKVLGYGKACLTESGELTKVELIPQSQ